MIHILAMQAKPRLEPQRLSRKSLLTVEKMVFVNLNENGEPAPHGRTKICYADEAFARYRENISPVVQPQVMAT